jgi:hypothetical protein
MGIKRYCYPEKGGSDEGKLGCGGEVLRPPRLGRR